MKKTISMVLMIAILCVVIPTKIGFCAGIPVFDASNLMNQIQDYLQQIMIYEEAIAQTSSMTKQYFQMIQDYQQVLKEYNHYLNQIKSVRHMIDNEDWLRIIRTIDYYYGKSKRTVIVESDINDPAYEEDMNVVLSQYGHVPRDPYEVESEARALGIWTDQYEQQVREDWERYEIMKDRLRMTSDNKKKSKERLENIIPRHAETLDNLGDESDLATMQEMAAQNQTIMNQMEHQNLILNQILLNMESEEARRSAISARWRETEIERLKNRKTTQLLGRDRWGSF